MGVRKNCRKFLPSPTRWVIQFSNFVLRWVCRRTILVFLIWELLVCALTIWWLWEFKKAADLGWVAHDWRTYVCFCAFRIFAACGGILAVGKRRISWTKYFFGSFWLSFLFGCWVLVPIAELSCECTDFQQCSALQAFTTADGPAKWTPVPSSESELLNPFHPPDAPRYNSRRVLKYEEPPSNPSFASPAPGAKGKSKKRSRSNLQLLARSKFTLQPNVEVAAAKDTEVVEVDRAGYGRHRRATNRGYSTALAETSPHTSAWGQVTNASDPFRGYQGQLAVLNTAKDSVAPLHLYNATDSSLYWVADDPLANSLCQTVSDLSERDRVKIADRLQEARNDMLNGKAATNLVDGVLYSKLLLCAADPLCGAVGAELIQTIAGTRYNYRVCELDIQLVPKPTERTHPVKPLKTPHVAALAHYLNEEGLDTYSAYFQKNPVAVKNDLEAGKSQASVTSSYYMRAFKGISSDEGMHLISRIEKEECTCEREDSCKVYKDVTGMTKFWCWVASESRKACVLNDIDVFWDDKAQKLWTDGICTGACDCVNIGMMPGEQDTDAIVAKLDQNQLNYGSTCDKWNQHDNLPWCYVGFDSTCADRKRRDKTWGRKAGSNISNSGPASVPMLFSSRLPCNKEEQLSRIQATANSCEIWSGLAQWGCILHMLLFPIMASVIFQFLANQCGDEWKREAQFAAIVDSDDDDSDDDPEPLRADAEQGAVY